MALHWCGLVPCPFGATVTEITRQPVPAPRNARSPGGVRREDQLRGPAVQPLSHGHPLLPGLFLRGMRHLLALLAIVGLLFSPVAATAAQRQCAETGAQMGGMAMGMSAVSPDQSGPVTSDDPCCDHGKTPPSSKSCVQACAVMCGIVGALPTSQAFPPAPERAQLSAAPASPLTSHSPFRTERPPRSIA
jgi:hypothetical protein